MGCLPAFFEPLIITSGQWGTRLGLRRRCFRRDGRNLRKTFPGRLGLPGAQCICGHGFRSRSEDCLVL